MSYNISAMKVTELELRLPVSFDIMRWIEAQPMMVDGYENSARRWLREDPTPILQNVADQTWVWEFGEQSLSGTIEGATLVLRHLDWSGEGSGTLYTGILLPLFCEFNGTLSAVVVWEGGDTIERVGIKGGNVESVEIT